MNAKNTIYEHIPVVAGLNKVQGFDPRKFMRRAVSEQTKQEILYLDLKYKKLWFRLVCPKGRIKTTALKITEQLAIIEAKIFFDKNDKEPASTFIAQRNAKDTLGSLYIEAAQYAAVDQALIDAGFGLQFCDISHGPDTELLDEGIPLADTGTVQRNTTMDDPKQETDPFREEPLQTITETEIPEVSVPATEVTVPEERSVEQPIRQTDPIHQEMNVMETAPASVAPESPVTNMTEEVYQDIFPYTADMQVEDICQLMTLEEAGAIIVEVGTCKGWTLEQVAQRRVASLKWYLNGYTGDNNILRAGAKLLLEREQGRMAG